MYFKNLLSLIFFILFFSAYALKLFWMKKQYHIKANVLAKHNKDRVIQRTETLVKAATLIWGISWLIFSLFEKTLVSVTGIWFKDAALEHVGLGFLSVGLTVFIISMLTMKSSWRVGIDKQTASSLVSDGIYRFSRNPAFVGFDLMFLGLFITFPNGITCIIAVLNLIVIHRLILQEEKHLKNAFGAAYSEYTRKTPRYILFKRGRGNG